MPVYNAQSPPPFLGFDFPLLQATVWNKEAIGPLIGGGVSQQVQIPRSRGGSGALGIRVEIDFNANPGNVTIVVLESDSDVLGTGGYDAVPANGTLTQANLLAGPNGASTRLALDLQPFSGQFCALQCTVAPTNATITATARITRAA